MSISETPGPSRWCYDQAHEAPVQHIAIQEEDSAPSSIPDSREFDAVKRSEEDRTIQSLSPPENLPFIRDSPRNRHLLTPSEGQSGEVDACC